MYGIIGYPLLQTFSPGYFNRKFASLGIAETYEKFPLASVGELPGLLAAQPALKGLNVTMPYKQSVMPYLDELDDTARKIGAVNTILVRNGRLKGFNTDTTGFTNSLKPLLPADPLQALVLGTGGASRAVVYSLEQLDIPYVLVSRQPAPGQLSYTDLDQATMAAHWLIVNTTPLGMTPQTEACPDIPYHYLGQEHLLYDLIYHPEETLFLQRGKAQQARIKNGYDMLTGQAEAAWAIWNSR